MKETLDEVGVSGTAIGPADVRDTPHVKPSFEVVKDPEPEAVDPWLGRTLSNVYVIEEKIGEGGMGSVYSARHVHLEKLFAVKDQRPGSRAQPPPSTRGSSMRGRKSSLAGSKSSSSGTS